MTKKRFRDLKEIEEHAKERDSHPISRKRKITENNDVLLVRIPKEITEHLKITKGDKIHFYLEPKTENEDSDLKITLERKKNEPHNN